MDLLEQDDPDWYLVKHTNGLVGLAPSNYVQFIQQEEREEEQHYSQEKTIPVPPPLPPLNNAITPGSIPPPAVQPILAHSVSFFIYYYHKLTLFLCRLALEMSSMMMHSPGQYTNTTRPKRKRRRVKATYLSAMACFAMEVKPIRHHRYSNTQFWTSRNTYSITKTFTLKSKEIDTPYLISRLLQNQRLRPSWSKLATLFEQLKCPQPKFLHL